MEYRITETSGRTTVHIVGMLTFDDFSNFKSAIGKIQELPAAEVVIDLSETKMIDSAGIGMLFLASDKAKAAGKSLSIRGVSGLVEKVLGVAKVQDIIPVSSAA